MGPRLLGKRKRIASLPSVPKPAKTMAGSFVFGAINRFVLPARTTSLTSCRSLACALAIAVDPLGWQRECYFKPVT
jgi:hypothetical protein